METIPTCISYTARLSGRPEFARWAVDAATAGAALGDHERARIAALGEAVERFCGNVVPDTLPIASHAELARAGRAAVDPREFALYSRAQYARRGFPLFANAAEQARRREFVSRPLVELLQSRNDHPEIEEAAEPDLPVEVRLHRAAERVLVGEHPRQLQEDPGHAQPRITEERGERTQRAE
ncbi:YcaO-like family protein [Streptomyces sp. MS1.HAVA.3]|uniref:YcaO-like family protein n=1 Tax=Streptomyces caledonius TaxID=3134107 RepID=A0ABU8UES9_9ACTN